MLTTPVAEADGIRHMHRGGGGDHSRVSYLFDATSKLEPSVRDNPIIARLYLFNFIKRKLRIPVASLSPLNVR